VDATATEQTYTTAEAPDFLKSAQLDAGVIAPMDDGKFMSAFIRARKPV
jgi:hypothetical protein